MEESIPRKKKRVENSGMRVVHILLPLCVDFQHDMFFNVLKNVVGRVGRTRLVDHYIDNAFKSGMIAGEILIEENDILQSWKVCNAKKSLIRLSQLIGYWAIANSPTFAKIFFGENYESRENNVVALVSGTGVKTMTAVEVDNIIFPKMKCQLIELSVSDSTLVNLKNFVSVPFDEIGVENEVQISPRMKSFTIKEEYFMECWAALKRCKWIVNSNQEIPNLPSALSQSSRTGMDPEYTASTNIIPLNLAKDSSFGKAGQSSEDVAMDLSIRTKHALPLPSQERENDFQSQLMSEIRKSNAALRQEFENLRRDLPDHITAEFNKVNQTAWCNGDLQQRFYELEMQLKEKSTSFAEVQKANHTLQLQSAEQNLSLVESRKLVTSLKQELVQKSETLIELRSELNRINEEMTELKQQNQALKLELCEKNESFLEIEKLNRANVNLQMHSNELEMQLNEKCTSFAEMQKANQNLQLQSAKQNESLDESRKLITSLQQELVQKSGSFIALQSEMNQRNLAMTELEQTNQALKLELYKKDKAIMELEKLKTEIQSSIIEIQSEFNQKKIIMADHETANKVDVVTEDIPETSKEELSQITEPFETDDIIVQMCRDKLLGLKFAWIKFTKNDKFRPGFVHPTDPDGKDRAQEVTSDGYVSDEKLVIESFEDDIPDHKKQASQIKKLKLLNKKFKFSLK